MAVPPSLRRTPWVGLVLGAALARAGTTPDSVPPLPPEPPSAAAAAIDRSLVANGADIVLLGNSMVTTDVDLATVRSLLAGTPGFAAPGPRVAPANVFGTAAPVWYAVLKNRVYGTQNAPKLVVILGSLDAILGVDLPNELQRAVLDQQMGEADPTLVQTVFRGVYDAAVHERLQRLLAPACSASHLRTSDPGPGRPAYPIVPAALATPSESLLPDLIRLAASHGSRVLVVRAPLGPSARWKDADEARATDAARIARELGARWVDLAAEDLPESAFGDGVHMNEAGRTWMTQRLGQAIGAALTGADSGVGLATPGDAGIRATPPMAAIDLLPVPPLDLIPASRAVGPLPAPMVTPVPGTDVGGATVARYALTSLHVPTSEATFTASGRGACSPLRATAATASGPIRAIVSNAGLLVSRPDCTAVEPALPTLTASLDPNRGCEDAAAHARWLYPGDTRVIRLPTGVASGARIRLELGGGVVGGADGALPQRLHVSVRSGAHRMWVNEEVSLDRFRHEAPSFLLPSNVLRGRSPMKQAELTLRLDDAPAESAAWLLLTTIELTTAPAFPWAGSTGAEAR